MNPWYQNIDESYAIAELSSDMDIDFVGVKVGDVNGSVLTSSVERKVDTRSHRWPLVFELMSNKDNKGSATLITFTAENYERISGWQGTLEFDPSKVMVYGIKSDHQDINDENFDLTNILEGYITFSVSHNEITDLGEDDALFNLEILTKEDVDPINLFSLSSSKTSLEAYRGYSETVPLKIKNANKQSQILNVHPNPWIDQTTIDFTMADRSLTHWDFYDAQGKLLYHYEQWFEKGDNFLKVDSDLIDVIGVIYIKMNSDFGTSEFKMMKF